MISIHTLPVVRQLLTSGPLPQRLSQALRDAAGLLEALAAEVGVIGLPELPGRRCPSCHLDYFKHPRGTNGKHADSCALTNEPYRWCLYCFADCEEEDPQHAEWCPSETGLYLVSPLEPLLCLNCETSLNGGDYCAQIPLPDTDGFGHFEMVKTVCPGCAALYHLKV